MQKIINKPIPKGLSPWVNRVKKHNFIGGKEMDEFLAHVYDQWLKDEAKELEKLKMGKGSKKKKKKKGKKNQKRGKQKRR